MGKRFAKACVSWIMGFLSVILFISSGAIAQEKGSTPYKVIKTQEFIKSANSGERVRVAVLTGKDQAKNLNGIFGSMPPATAGAKLAYHYHQNRESIIQILSGDAIEMVEGQPVPLKPGDVIFIPPNTKHTLVNNSSTQELKYMEFYSPIASDSVQVKE